MLVFSHLVNDKAYITVPPSTEPTVIEIVPLDIRDRKVRIGYAAPRNVVVDREKVYHAKRKVTRAT